jgi:hypothetical protein
VKKIDLDRFESVLTQRWWTQNELAGHFATGRTQVHDALLALAARRAIFKIGRGVRDRPARYRICAVAKNVKVLA